VSRDRCEVAIVGSGFAGSLAARTLRTIGYDVVLLERGTHPRFAIGESTTPLANLALERLARRYGFEDCWQLAAHGRWTAHYPELRRGLKRGFTFYRHHPGTPFANDGGRSERLLVSASPDDAIADTHWLRADVDHHFVRQAIAAGVDYRDRAALTSAEATPGGMRLNGTRDGAPFELDAAFVIDASGPSGFLARQLSLPSALDTLESCSALVFSHFAGVRELGDVVPGLPEGPYPDDRAAVHHLVDEGWMYALRFDHGVTSAGFLLSPRGLRALAPWRDAPELWNRLLERYPTIQAVFAEATPTMPIAYVPRVQHRLGHAAGDRWTLLPHAFAFVDPLFSTGIAWGLRAVERLALVFEAARSTGRMPAPASLARYAELLHREATQIDRVVAGAYEAMAHFELFAAHAMIYFATVSFAEVGQRLSRDETAAWGGFLGVGDPVLEPLSAEALARLRHITAGAGSPGDVEQRAAHASWVAAAIQSRNVAGLADPSRANLYPADLDVLIDRHALLGLSREQMRAALPALRGMAEPPAFAAR